MALLNPVDRPWSTGYLTGGTYKMRKLERQMKHMTMMALMLCLGVASVYAQHSVKMVFSGTNGPSAINLLQPNTNTAEENYAGSGMLGSFTFRNVRATAAVPQSSST